MSIAQIILLLLVAYSIALAVRRVIKKQSSMREILTWLVFWAIGAVLIVKPGISQQAASFLGIGRGVDLVIYVAVIFGFMLQYELLTRQQFLEQKLTQLAREIALQNAQEHNQKSDGPGQN